MTSTKKSVTTSDFQISIKSFVGNAPVEKQNVSIMKHEIDVGRIKLIERKEIIT